MKNLIDLPADIKVGTKVWVTDSLEEPCFWLKGHYYVGTFNGKVFTVDDTDDQCACGWRRAKLPEVNWNEIPIGTRVQFKNEGDNDYRYGQLACVFNGVPYCTTYCDFVFNPSNGESNPNLYPYDYVEIVAKGEF